MNSLANACAIKQLLIHRFDDEALVSELRVRVREAQGLLKPAKADCYAVEAEKPTLSAAERLALLSRLVNDLQWRYTRDEVKRGYAKQITLRTGQTFMVSMPVSTCILYFSFVCGMVAGLAFPDLKSEARPCATSRQRPAPAPQPPGVADVTSAQAGSSPQPATKQLALAVFALRAVWCFTAGFSAPHRGLAGQDRGQARDRGPARPVPAGDGGCRHAAAERRASQRQEPGLNLIRPPAQAYPPHLLQLR